MSPLGVRYELLVLALLAFLPLWATAMVPAADHRQGRWMWGERETFYTTSTSTIPVKMKTASSCYVMETNLPKCESVRRRRDIKIDATPSVPILSTTAPVLEDIGGENTLGSVPVSSHRQSREYASGFVLGNAALDPSNDDQDIRYPTYGITPGSIELNRYARDAIAAPANQNNTVEEKNNSTVKVEPTAMGWLEYFYLKAITSTVTTYTHSTQWIVDPSHMMTFSVRGCEPKTMPFDMAKCYDSYLGVKNDTAIIETSTLTNASIAEDAPNKPATPENSQT